MKTKLAFLLLIAIATLLSCSETPDDKKTKENVKDTTDLKIAIMPVIDCLPFYVADEQQIYKKLGLNVRFISYKSLLKCGEVFENGRVDGTFATLPEAMYLKAGGKDLKIVMRTEGDMDVIANHAKRIKKLSSMRERLVAITRHSTEDYLSDEIANITNIPTFDILRPQINDIFIREQMLLNNQVDAAVMPQPYAEILRKEGHSKVFSTKNSGIKFGCIVISDTVTKSKSEKIELLLKGYSQAAEAIEKNRKNADSVLIKQYRIPAKMLDSVSIPKYPKPQNVNSKDFDKAMNWCISRKYVKERIKENDIITSKFIHDER